MYYNDTCIFDLDFTKICRLCLSQDRPLCNIFEEKKCLDKIRRPSLASQIAACVAIAVEPESKLPDKICNRCREQVDNWLKFKELCDNANTLLHQCHAAGISPPEIIEEANCPGENTQKARSSFFLEEVSLLENDSIFQKIENSKIECLNSNELLDNDSLSLIFNEGSKNVFFGTEIKTEVDKEVENEKKKTYWREKYKRIYKKEYICGVCPSIFTKFYDLLKHDEHEHKDESSKEMCKSCGKLFINGDRLKTHIDIKHKEGLHECEICGFRSVSEKALKFHKVKHIEKFKCFCGFIACNAKRLEDHKRSHDSVRTHQCTLCPKIFKQYQGLQNHIKQKHESNDESTYKCDLCLQVFKRSDYLRKHKTKVHTLSSEICEICGVVMKNKATLRIHKLTHKDKKHSCTECDKKFVTKNLLTRHMRIHLGDRPFVCQVCDKSYNRSDALSLHLKTHMTSPEITQTILKLQLNYSKLAS